MTCVRTIVTKRKGNYKCVSLDGSTLALLSTDSRDIVIRDSGNMRIVRDCASKCAQPFLSSDGPLLAVTEDVRCGRINVWDHTTGRRVAELRGHTMTWIFFLPDLLVSASYDGTIQLWRTDDWAAPPVVIEYFDAYGTACVRGVALSPQNNLIASFSVLASMLFLWRITPNPIISVEAVGTLKVPSISCIALQSKGQLLAAGCFKVINIFDTSNINSRPRMLCQTGGMRSLAFSPCDRQLASLHYQTVRMWDVATGACVHTLQMPSISPPKTVRTWDMPLPPGVCEVVPLVNNFMDAFYISQGKQLIATTYTGDIHTWTLCKWSDHTHHLFGPDLKRYVFQLMCVRARLAADDNRVYLPIELWLMVMAHLSLCIAESGVVEDYSW